MQVIDPTTVTPTNGARIIPVPPFPSSPAAPVGGADRKSGGGQNARQQAASSGARFRAVLDAATVAGFGRVADGVETPSDSATPFQGTAPSRMPSSSQELNAADTPELLRAVRAYAAGETGELPQEPSSPSEPTAEIDPTRTKLAQTAAIRYAQSFFSVGGTFAARGDTLELSA